MTTASIETWTTAEGLVAALAVGLLIGVERGWRDRDLAEGGRVAGLRTFALVGLLGGVLGSLAADLGAWILPGGFVGLSLLLAVSYREAARKTGNLSVTTAVATLLAFMLGVLAARGAPALALAAAVVTTVLLNLKPTLHAWLQRVESRELSAALQLLVLSVVILPNLPDAGYGPYQALNPYRLWWAVVLIAGLSLAGHFAMRLTGAQRGIFLTGLLGGLASSTAATLAL
ncbi:MAG: MgtC/SapB family protein, partial [Rubrivivax sp.]